MSWAAVAVGAGTAIAGVATSMSGKNQKTTQASGGSTFNQGLSDYTKQFRATSPWMFASLDPTAALAAMGGRTVLGGKNLGAAGKQQLKNMSKQEQDEAKFGQEALDRIRKRQESGQFLTPQETSFINQSLDKAFAYAHKTGYEDWTRATQMMAGSRGLRMSDTPVAQPALQELRNFELGLGSQRAQMGLDATLGMSQQQNAFDAGLQQFQANLAQNKWATRQQAVFGGGMNAMGQLNTRQWGNVTQTFAPSTTQMVSQGMSLAGQGLQLGGAIASPFARPAPSVPTPAAPGGGGWGGMMGMNSNPYQ